MAALGALAEAPLVPPPILVITAYGARTVGLPYISRTVAAQPPVAPIYAEGAYGLAGTLSPPPPRRFVNVGGEPVPITFQG